MDQLYIRFTDVGYGQVRNSQLCSHLRDVTGCSTVSVSGRTTTVIMSDASGVDRHLIDWTIVQALGPKVAFTCE